MTANLCAAQRRNGAACRRPAGWGTKHPGYGNCKPRGGATRNGQLHAAKLLAADQATRIGIVMGFPIDVDPLEALLECIRIAAGEVSYCSDRIAELDASDAIVTFREHADRGGPEGEGWSESKTSTAATLHIWIVARRDALDRLARFSKMAIDAGVAERLVAIAEGLGQAIGGVLRAVLGDLNLTEEQLAIAPESVRRHLRLLESPQQQEPPRKEPPA
jgi:hypothetical protein